MGHSLVNPARSSLEQVTARSHRVMTKCILALFSDRIVTLRIVSAFGRLSRVTSVGDPLSSPAVRDITVMSGPALARA